MDCEYKDYIYGYLGRELRYDDANSISSRLYQYALGVHCRESYSAPMTFRRWKEYMSENR